jgi:hypothetical protein
MTLSPTQAAILSAAARHPERLAAPPPKLAPAPRDAVRKSLLARGLIAPTAEAIDPTTAWTADATLVGVRHVPLRPDGHHAAGSLRVARVP